MVNKIDSALIALKNLLQEGVTDAPTLTPRGAAMAEDGQSAIVEVLVQFTGSLAPLQAAGLTVVSRFDEVVTGRISSNDLEALAQVENVVRIQGSQIKRPRMDRTTTDVNADHVNTGAGIGLPPRRYRGAGVIVGIIDSGIDYTHNAFRNADGTSRILSIWDQNATAATAGGTVMTAPFNNGKEFTKAQLDAALLTANPLTSAGHTDTDGHGTHVASIAAGNLPNRPGIAPDADLIIVSTSFSDARLLEAIDYIHRRADAAGKPCVINMSLGGQTGAHDGTELLDLAINKAVGRPNKALVIAAGNAGRDNIHTSATIAPGASTTLTMFAARPVTGAGNVGWVGMEIWYPTGGQLTATITDHNGFSRGPQVQPASGTTFQSPWFTPAGTGFDLTMNPGQPQNGHDQIVIDGNYVAPLAAGATWTVQLTNTGTTPVTFDAWCTDGNYDVHFTGAPGAGPFVENIDSPGSAREAICVGAYSARTAPTGVAANFTSRGPTHDNRIKPDISAPGVNVQAAASQGGPAAAGANGLDTMGGTSMATPVVTGAVALLLEKTPGLTQEQIRRALTETARTDANTGTGTAVPNNTYGAGKLDVQALMGFDTTAGLPRTWVRVRSTFFNWTMGDTPPSFEIMSNENGHAIIELAWGSQDIPRPPTRDPDEPLRYYHTDETLTAVQVTKADGTTMPITVPPQNITLTNNKATWTMPQQLWDAYREELSKGMQSPPASQMRQMLYYRVRFEPAGVGSPIVWPADASFDASPFNNRMGIIALNAAPSTQVMPDTAAVNAMPRLKSQLEWLWAHLDPTHPDRVSLMNIFSHRLFTNSIETEIRGKILTLWMLAGPARQRLHLLIERMFQRPNGLEMTALKQKCLVENKMLIDHLLELSNITPNPDLPGVRASEQLLDDVLSEIFDPNGQANQGASKSGVPAAIQAMLLESNPAEYVRMMKGLLSPSGQSVMGDGTRVTIPADVFRAAIYAGDQSNAYLMRTNSELAFHLMVMVKGLGDAFPQHDVSAAALAPSGPANLLQRVMDTDLTSDQIKTVLGAVFAKSFTATQGGPSPAIRSQFVADLTGARQPVLAHLKWGGDPTVAATPEQAVVAIRSEAGRVYYKNPRYAGSAAAGASITLNGVATQPPRRFDDPTQSLESMGDDDLQNWVTEYYTAVATS